MIEKIKCKMMSDKVYLRLITTFLCFLIVFALIAIISNVCLPEGILRNKNPLQSWDNSPKQIVLMFQIFFFNLLSVIMLLVGNLFRTRKNDNRCFITLGYLAFFVMISINAITLGTWSFSVVSEAVPLADRIIQTFDLVHRAGLWEMTGQLFIVCATVNISLIITDKKVTTTKSIRSIKLKNSEKLVVVMGLLLILMGAFIESRSIIQLS